VKSNSKNNTRRKSKLVEVPLSGAGDLSRSGVLRFAQDDTSKQEQKQEQEQQQLRLWN
jgi:hypothetical protein